MGDPGLVGKFLLFCVLQSVKRKETNPTRPGSPTPCKQGLSLKERKFIFFTEVFTAVVVVQIGSFNNDNGDGNEDVKKAVVLLRKTTTLHVNHPFWYIYLPSLHDYDVKMPNCKFYGGRNQATTNLFFPL